MLIFGLHSTPDDRLSWLIDSNSICHPSPAKKRNACFWIMFNFWWLAGLVDGLKPNLLPLSSQKNEMLIFRLRLLLMISQAGRWTWTPSATPFQQKTWNAHFWIMFNFWWSAGLVNGLEPHLPPLSSQKKWNAHFWITFNFWWLAGLVNGLESHLPPLSSQKNKKLASPVKGLPICSSLWMLLETHLHWDIYVFISFSCNIPLLGLISTGPEKRALFWRFSCRTVNIPLRYLHFRKFWP